MVNTGVPAAMGHEGPGEIFGNVHEFVDDDARFVIGW